MHVTPVKEQGNKSFYFSIKLVFRQATSRAEVYLAVGHS